MSSKVSSISEGRPRSPDKWRTPTIGFPARPRFWKSHPVPEGEGVGGRDGGDGVFSLMMFVAHLRTKSPWDGKLVGFSDFPDTRRVYYEQKHVFSRVCQEVGEQGRSTK